MSKKAIIILVIILIVVAGGAYSLTHPRNWGPFQQKSADDNKIQGMKIETLKEGTGPEAKAGDLVTVHYVGTLENGTKFDSSVDRGQPFQFTLGQNMVIQGWELGVAGMKAGEKRKLTIPPELGYGSQGAGGVIPPNATLIFEIDLLHIN